MNKTEILTELGALDIAKEKWAKRITEFNSGVDAIMSRLLHEAAAAFMSPEDVARASGYSVKQVRQRMRDCGLNPRDGKRLLGQKAAEALANNAALLGIEPSEMDLMSPLAYLPMGEQMRRELQDKTVSQVHEIPEVHGINYVDHGLGCDNLAMEPAVLVTHDVDKITCEGCRKALIREDQS